MVINYGPTRIIERSKKSANYKISSQVILFSQVFEENSLLINLLSFHGECLFCLHNEIRNS